MKHKTAGNRKAEAGRKKVLVGMSGGVDSAAAAIILKEKGYEVTGMTLKLWDDASRCCNYEEVLAAKKTCWKLGIKHYVINARKNFKKCVVDYFVNEYLGGRTPNPCAVCNEEVKFTALIKKMKELSYDRVATGHYAAIEKGKKGFVLKKGKDKKKTQEYFLARLPARELKYIIFPLGKMKKQDSRAKVREYGLDHEKKDSQEVCFLKDGESPFEFIKRIRNPLVLQSPEGGGGKSETPKGKRGWLEDTAGNRLKPLDFDYYKYTVGQRKGLNYSGGRPMYVVSVDPENKRVIIGDKREAYKKEFTAGALVNLPAGKRKFRAGVKIRYLHAAEKATVEINGKEAKVTFDEPQFAVTPGQMAVFYDRNSVIGSGFIK